MKVVTLIGSFIPVIFIIFLSYEGRASTPHVSCAVYEGRKDLGVKTVNPNHSESFQTSNGSKVNISMSLSTGAFTIEVTDAQGKASTANGFFLNTGTFGDPSADASLDFNSIKIGCRGISTHGYDLSEPHPI